MKYIALISLLISSTPCLAQQCTYEQGQKKMIEFNNMMQQYNREFIALMEKTGDSNAELEAKRLAMAEESSKLGILLGKEFEKNNQLQNNDPISPAICEGYDKLMEKYSPKNYQTQPVTAAPAAVDNKCNSKTLWNRYGKAIQKEEELVSKGKITNEEVNSYMTISTYIGQYATTDMAKACEYLKKFEDKLAAE